MTRRSRPSPWEETRALVTRLARAGWGDLASNDLKGARATLRALVDVLPYKSGLGSTTVPQIADASGYSLPWTREALRALVELGVVEWFPGGIDASGVAQPSFVRLVKTVLVQLVHAARDVHALVLSDRRRETAERIEKYRLKRTAKRYRRSEQGKPVTPPAVSTGLHLVKPLDKRSNPDAAGDVMCPHDLPRRRMPSGEYECPLCRQRERIELGRRTAAEDDGRLVLA